LQPAYIHTNHFQFNLRVGSAAGCLEERGGGGAEILTISPDKRQSDSILPLCGCEGAGVEEVRE